MFKTIKSKFITITLILITFSVGIPFLFLMNQFKKNFDQRSEIMIKSAFDLVIHNVYDKMITEDYKDIQAIMNDIANNPSVEHVRIIDENAIVMYGQPHEGSVLVKITPEIRNKVQRLLDLME